MNKRPSEIPQKTHRAGAYKQNKKPLFLEAFRKTGTIVSAARSVGISREVVYDWRNNDIEFCKEFGEIEVEITERLESTALERATEGVKKPIYYKGKKVGVTREYSDGLSMFLLKARNPRYRDRIVQEIDPKTIDFIVNAFIEAIRQNVPEACPNCRMSVRFTDAIANQLGELSQKFAQMSTHNSVS